MVESNFNQLTPAQTERLALAAEEMAEASQIIGKILRHGIDSYNPFLPPPAGDTNRQKLEKELADVLLSIDLLIAGGDIDEKEIADRKRVKHNRIWGWLHHQDQEVFRLTEARVAASTARKSRYEEE